MSVEPEVISERIREAFPDAEVAVRDLVGDRDHYSVRIVSSAFAGKTRLQQHRMVLEALREVLGSALHALAVHTEPPSEERAALGPPATRETSPMSEAAVAAAPSPEARARIEGQIAADPVVLYMKGTAEQPLCGFSAAVVQILRNLSVPFREFNVLADPELREGVKVFSDWPTIPQLYVKGEFVGGCDIVREMWETGELASFLEQKGVAAAAPAA